MAFKAQPQRPYVIIPKHSRRPLGPQRHDRHRGLHIQQQDAYLNHVGQQVHLDPTGNGEHWVHVVYCDKYWDIERESQAAGAKLLQWDWGGGAPNQHFRLAYAGDGYYYLRPAHSGQTLEVAGAGRSWEDIQQNHLNPNLGQRDYQLFRIVPASPDYLPHETVPFRQYSDLLRDVVMGLTGAVPKVGGLFKGALGVFWPDGHDQDFWNQMTQYVEQRVKQLLKQEHIASLKEALEGAKDILDEVERTHQPNDRREKLHGALMAANFVKARFKREEEGISVLPLLVAWGTLLLALRLEIYINYEDLHPDEKDANRMALGKAEALRELQGAIEEFGRAVTKARAKAVQWRLGKISRGSEEGRESGGGRTRIVELWRRDWVTDSYDGWQQQRSWRSRSSTTHDRSNEPIMAQVLAHRKTQVQAQFEAELDVLLAPAYLWPYVGTANKPSAQLKAVVVGPFARPDSPAFGALAGTLRSITLFTHPGNQPHGYLSGLHLTYTDGQSLRVGSCAGTQQELLLNVGEYVTNVRGHQWDVIEQLTIETNQGRVISAGQVSHPSYFEAGLDDAVNARLTGISGHQKGDFFTALSFHWEYTVVK
ncbi:RICIN domain-containing protein [Hymenobacter sp. CRA2]|uniref:RICIN domain-containing protein n=1 Tax=Hymenobacter sp. CRA2 TaxID=1955620 RepID=UPI00098E8971|nr:RICIN domain-containing protein [Hymenobacter sp. CRA2]OON68856.1 hypothetical protein B0919_11830 [Hymenobacter sp. CRA2]